MTPPAASALSRLSISTLTVSTRDTAEIALSPTAVTIMVSAMPMSPELLQHQGEQQGQDLAAGKQHFLARSSLCKNPSGGPSGGAGAIIPLCPGNGKPIRRFSRFFKTFPEDFA